MQENKRGFIFVNTTYTLNLNFRLVKKQGTDARREGISPSETSVLVIITRHTSWKL